MVPRRDYHRKEFRNPFFPKRQGEARKRHPVLYWAGTVLVVLGLLVWLNSAGTFTLDTVEVQGSTISSQAEIQTVVTQQFNRRCWFIFSQHSIFFFNTDQAEESLATALGERYVTVSKKYFKTIRVAVTETVPILVWSSQQQTFYVDRDGTVLRQTGESTTVVEPGRAGTEVVRSQTQFNERPLVIDSSNAEVTVNQAATSPQTAAFIINLADALQTGGTVQIAHFVLISPYADYVTLRSVEGWEAYFKIADSVDQQASRLVTVLQQRVDDRSRLEYIDLRYGDKIFYK